MVGGCGAGGLALRDTALLLSGGLDSITLAHDLYKQDKLAACLFFDYGQLAAQEERKAFWAFTRARLDLEAEELRIGLNGMTAMLQETGAEGPRIVPARNLVLISMAVNWAAPRGLKFVAIGATGGDQAAYADCRDGWLGILSHLTDEAAGVLVVAPYTRMNKRDVAKRAVELGVALSDSWSCYSPAESGPCGSCNACRERDDAVEHAARIR
jgi:7-cyano-7-deazaguanine synthase